MAVAEGSGSELEIKHHLPEHAEAETNQVVVQYGHFVQVLHVLQKGLELFGKNHRKSSCHFTDEGEVEVGNHRNLDNVHVNVAVP